MSSATEWEGGAFALHSSASEIGIGREEGPDVPFPARVGKQVLRRGNGVGGSSSITATTTTSATAREGDLKDDEALSSRLDELRPVIDKWQGRYDEKLYPDYWGRNSLLLFETAVKERRRRATGYGFAGTFGALGAAALASAAGSVTRRRFPKVERRASVESVDSFWSDDSEYSREFDGGSLADVESDASVDDNPWVPNGHPIYTNNNGPVEKGGDPWWTKFRMPVSPPSKRPSPPHLPIGRIFLAAVLGAAALGVAIGTKRKVSKPRDYMRRIGLCNRLKKIQAAAQRLKRKAAGTRG